MKYIKNVKVPLVGRARNMAVAAKAAAIDTEGAYTSPAHFLCGENMWGFHQDMRFSLPIGQVKIGERILAAAEGAIAEMAPVLVLSDDDYEVLLNAVIDPKRHPSEMAIPPILARAILPVINAILQATS